MTISVNGMMRFLLWIGMFWMIAACQGPVASENQSQPSAMPPGATPTAAPGQTSTVRPTQPGTSGLNGQVISASDVSSQPDQPLPDQMVLAVPVEKAGDVLGLSSAELTDEKLRFLKAALPGENPAITVTLSGKDGGYMLTLAPGDYVLCVADSQQSPPSFPAKTRGCGRTAVREGEMRRVDISSGFGEILLVER